MCWPCLARVFFWSIDSAFWRHNRNRYRAPTFSRSRCCRAVWSWLKPFLVGTCAARRGLELRLYWRHHDGHGVPSSGREKLHSSHERFLGFWVSGDFLFFFRQTIVSCRQGNHQLADFSLCACRVLVDDLATPARLAHTGRGLKTGSLSIATAVTRCHIAILQII